MALQHKRTGQQTGTSVIVVVVVVVSAVLDGAIASLPPCSDAGQSPETKLTQQRI